MKAFYRKKIINGIEYIYKIQPYYDSTLKKTRQESTYVGKLVDGVIKKVREFNTKDVLSYGEFLPIMKIINQYQIDKFLVKELGERSANTVIALSLGRLIRGISLQNTENWYTGTWLYRQTRDLPLSPSSISRLLSKIGESRIQDKLSSHLIRQLKSKRTILYDITSISSYSELMKLLEWGYNRDQLDLPQINLSVILDKEEGIPLGYEIYPGSISDVVTLKNTIKKIKIQGVKNFTIVLDRGFFSISNLDILLNNNTDFIMAVPDERYKSAQSLINSLSAEIEKPKYLKQYCDEIIFVKDVEIIIGNHKLNGYCYFNPKRAQQEKDSFYKRLFDIQEKLKNLKISPNIQAKIEEITGNLKNYFSVHISQNQIEVEIKEKAVSRRLNKKGLFIIVINGDYSWDSCLSNYREKELIERSFNILKNDLELSTPNVQKDSTLKGLMFICLIALIIRMKIMSILKEKNLIKSYSFESLMITLEKFKAIILDNGKVIFNELTKNQRLLLEAFDAVPKL